VVKQLTATNNELKTSQRYTNVDSSLERGEVSPRKLEQTRTESEKENVVVL